jgi:4-amino-4-deoxy-L-arabinose transferase-like glycosyltransferase
MIRDLQANHFLLPFFTSYNYLQIPYAYPPLRFYLAAGLNSLFGTSLITLLQWSPAVLSTLTILAIFGLAQILLGNKRRAALASGIYALTPQAFEWQVMGGGLTSALGAIFAILTVYFAVRTFLEKKWWLPIAAVLTGTLTLLNHPEWTFQAAAAGLLSWILFGRNKAGMIRISLVDLGVFVLSSPWWLTVAFQHDFGVFIQASQTPQGRWLFWWPLLSMSFAGATNIMVIALGLLGVFVCV